MGIKPEPLTRNIRKPGVVGILNFCTFAQSCNGLISWSFEFPASAYCQTLCAMLKSQRSVKHIWFLPTHKANTEKPKELALSHRS